MQQENKSTHHTQATLNEINNQYHIRNHESRKSVGWHIQGIEVKRLSTKNSILCKGEI